MQVCTLRYQLINLRSVDDVQVDLIGKGRDFVEERNRVAKVAQVPRYIIQPRDQMPEAVASQCFAAGGGNQLFCTAAWLIQPTADSTNH